MIKRSEKSRGAQSDEGEMKGALRTFSRREGSLGVWEGSVKKSTERNGALRARRYRLTRPSLTTSVASSMPDTLLVAWRPGFETVSRRPHAQALRSRRLLRCFSASSPSLREGPSVPPATKKQKAIVCFTL
ncbi:hypothetical protein SKAU_G00103060 [Synaphobranchus kaupii]|uniref:Uncharacterized protein n=1 Tax=Synaphobranchus kaupii TaxID=118154 RepID=A0A9Q1J7M8_SYNKA|nr:hypothetical protein SKAU_G00103060 [Synaphobranchus kaupii]